MLVDSTVKIYNGQTEIVKAYCGTDVVYEKAAPVPYTKLKYISSNKTSSQYINPNLPNNPDAFRIQMKFALNDLSAGQVLYGAEDRNSPYRRNYFKRSTNKFDVGIYMYNDAYYSVNIGTIVEAEINAVKGTTSYLKMDGTQVWSTNDYKDEDRSSLSIYIFCIHRGTLAQDFSSMKLYYMKIYDKNDTLVRDFIPVLDENDVACLYDKVTNAYFYNLGSGTFGYELE